ncbi:hypothetical protein PTKIN_Ptkin12aG0016200 [Pterospermum kingtungense]
MEEDFARQPKQKQSPDESERELKNIRGRKPKLDDDQKHKNKLLSCKKYRQKQATEKRDLRERNEELEENNKKLEKENEELKLKLSKVDAQTGKLGTEMSDGSKKVKLMEMVHTSIETGMQKLQKNFLNQDDQEHWEENLDIPLDEAYLNKWLEGVTEIPCPLWSKTTGFLSGEGTSSGLSQFVELVNVEGFRVPKEYCAVIQEIFRQYPNIASGFQVRRPATKNGFINTLAEVYKMAKEEQHTPEEIKDMEDGIADLVHAGLDIPWLKTLVAERREDVELKEEIKNKKAELKLLEERQSKCTEERKSKRQRYN